MIEIAAKEKGFCAVRINLDEGDAISQLNFFYKIFDSVLTEACSIGAYGGLHGKTYDVYCDMVSAYEIPLDSTFCPFIFPSRYAKAMSKGNVNSVIPDTNFERDLKAIQNEIQRPMVLLFDECDVLSQSRIHLQKLRNIFMNIPSFMLVLTGTPNLFPIIDEVFSPIVRQFKKIKIEPFEDEDETGDCIQKPLEKIGISHPAEIFDLETFSDVSEIHDLTGGRPYEIQLLCHFLFRRIQEGRAKRMKLTLDVLDDVLNELNSSQDITIRPVLNAVRNLERSQLAALSKLCRCNHQATLVQIWTAEYVFKGESEWTKESLEKYLNHFVEKGVISVANNTIDFSGDEFDRIYCKYLARKFEINLAINDIPYEILLGFICLDDLLVQNELDDTIASSSLFVGKLQSSQIQRVLATMQSNVGSNIVENPFSIGPDVAEELYWSSIDSRHKDNFEVAVVMILTQWVTIRRWFRCHDMRGTNDFPLKKLLEILEEPSKRAQLVGASLEVEILNLPVISWETLTNIVIRSNDKRLMERLGNKHLEMMTHEYLKHKDYQAALFHGEIAYIYMPNEAAVANNLGYIYLAYHKLLKAKNLFESALELYEEEHDMALPNYNLGIIDMMQGNLHHALDRFKVAVEEIKHADSDDRKCLRLILPVAGHNGSEKIDYIELESPDLLDTLSQAMLVIKSVMDGS